MEAQVVFHEGRNKIIAVVIALLQTDLHLLASALANLSKNFGLQLLHVKGITCSLINENFSSVLVPSFDQFRSVICFPTFAIIAKVAGKSFFSQGTCDGATMGENAEMDLYRPGFLRPMVSAPCPPME